jgi:GT2 family glycosyltransferase
VIPTRARPHYLKVALDSIAPQAEAVGAELVVVDDAGPTPQARALSERAGARYEPHECPRGLNVARNTGVERSHGELVAFVDDDVRAAPGWLRALLDAARAHSDVDVFTGPIRPRLEGARPRGCGREGPPITALELGERDTEARYAWGANMTIRRRALERVGPFEEALADGGDEQEWQDRLRAQTPATRVLYVAGAAVEHRREGADARLRALARAAYVRGRASRRFDRRRGEAPARPHELVTLAGCVGHVVRRRCPAGIVMVAHSAGRLREALRETRAGPVPSSHDGPLPPGSSAVSDGLDSRSVQDSLDLRASAHSLNFRAGANLDLRADSDLDFLSGESGTVGGLDALRRRAQDGALDAWELLSGRRARLELAARRLPSRRRVLALGVVRPERRVSAEAIRAELERSRHDVELHTRLAGGRGKFENLNELLAAHPAAEHDWLLLIDDDVELPRHFLDRFLFLSERFSLALAQPAQRLHSHAAWRVTRRRAGSVVRETNFVEIGPVTAFAAPTFAMVLPFPELSMGWGLDVHWAALARTHGWRCGVVDAVAIAHRVAPAGDAYPRAAAIAEARAFLAERPYVSAREAQRTLTTHRRW